MSQTIPLSTTSKKRLDERNGRLVKELSTVGSNKNCVECGTRGPNYVNLTTASFCCSACAGALRGLNPPHRVKSILMSTFTSEEFEKLKAGGNAENEKIWMSLYSGPTERNIANNDERTRFLIQKYEKKQWWVSPEEVERQRELMEKATEARSEKIRSHRQETDLLGIGGSSAPPPSISLDSVFSPPSRLEGVQFQRPHGNGYVDEPPTMSPPSFMAPPPPQVATAQHTNFPFGISSSFTPAAPVATPSTVPSGLTIDPFSPLNQIKHFPQEPTEAVFVKQPTASDPFGDSFSFFPSTSNTQSAPQSDPFATKTVDPFAGFAVRFDESPSIPCTVSSAVAKGTSTSNTLTTPLRGATIGRSESTIVSTLPDQSIPTVPAPSQSITSATHKPVQSDGDKYSALAELDELFHNTSFSGDSSHVVTSEVAHKPSWISSGFSAPAPSQSFSTPCMQNGVSKSSTMGAISSIPHKPVQSDPFSTTQHAYSQSNLTANPFAPPQIVQQPMQHAFPQHAIPQSQYAQAAAMTGNPFSIPTQQPHSYGGFPPIGMNTQQGSSNQQQNPFWNPFLS